jgi:uncharacterized membrane protein
MRRISRFVPAAAAFVLAGLALLGANAIRQKPDSGMLGWQAERFSQLLLITAAWFIFLGGILAARALTQRRSSPSSSGRPPSRLNVAPLLLAVLIIAFVAGYGWLSLTRHQRFNSTGYDLAINEQIVWNTLHGRFFASSLEVDNSFADHFRPFLAFLIPIYAAFPSPSTLLIVQTVALAASALPLYLLARDKLADPSVSLAIVGAYLLYPALGFIARFDFHIEALAIPALIAAFLAMERDRWGWASFWLLIPLLCKENLGLTVAAVGLYALLIRRKVAFGMSWMAVGLTAFWATSFWLIPTLRGEASDTMTRYSWLGESPLLVLAALATRPAEVWQVITEPSRLYYLLQLFLPVGLLALLAIPELLPAVPGLALNLLARHHCQPTIFCQYAVPIVPFIFVALVYAIARLRTVEPFKSGGDRAWRLLGLALVPLAFATWLVDNPFLEDTAVPPALTEIDNASVVRIALEMVPAQGSLVTTNDYAPHLAQRPELYIIGIPAQREPPTDPDSLLINLYDQQYIVCDQYRTYLAQLDIDRYGVVFRTGGLVVILRNGGSNEQFRDLVLNWSNCAG